MGCRGKSTLFRRGVGITEGGGSRRRGWVMLFSISDHFSRFVHQSRSHGSWVVVSQRSGCSGATQRCIFRRYPRPWLNVRESIS
jgi:hypothetical protein